MKRNLTMIFELNTEQNLVFAETCMLNLLSTKPENSEYSEISSLDLHKIKQVINKFNKEE